MAEEINIPIVPYPDRVNSANGLFSQMSMTQNLHMPRGLVLPTASAVNYHGGLVLPIPANINGTPAGKVYMIWTTASTDTTSQIKLIVRVSDKATDTDSLDHSSWDDDLSVQDTSTGQYRPNKTSVSLSTTSQTAGKLLVFLIRRDYSGEAGDTLNADCFMTHCWYTADST